MTLKEELADIEAQLERLEERKREIYRLSVEAPESEKVCENHLAEMLGEPEFFQSIKYPTEISGISFSGELVAQRSRRERGQLVQVRPCAPEFEKKTYLGIYLGDYAQHVSCSINRTSRVLDVRVGSNNPTIWIPSRQAVVYGSGSWWGPIDSEDQLREITNESIDGIWYVQAMRALLEGKCPKAT